MSMSHGEGRMASLPKAAQARREFLAGVASLGALAMLPFLVSSCSHKTRSTPAQPSEGDAMKLPEPRKVGDVSVEEALLSRRSIRSYSGEGVTLEEVSQLLWATQGITDSRGFRTAPSAGALYPLEVYVLVGEAEGLATGVFRYEAKDHRLSKAGDGDRRARLASAALGQSFVKEGAVVFVLAGVYERTTRKYGGRGMRYVHIEVGHAAQNLCLQATALGLGAVTIGAFSDWRVSGLLNLPEGEQPLYVIPVGRR